MEPRREDVEKGIRSVLAPLRPKTADERAWRTWATRFLERIDSTPDASFAAADYDDSLSGWCRAAAWAAHHWARAQALEGDNRARALETCRKFLEHLGVEVPS